MLFLGQTGSANCIIKYANEGATIIGSKNAFLGYKLDSLSGNNGIFAQWDFQDDTLIGTNDALGFFPVYYTISKNSFAVSSSILDLIGLIDGAPQLDDAAIAVFLRTGSFIGNTTPFEKIKALPPGAQFIFSKGRFSLESNKIKIDKELTIPLSAAYDIYGELFHNSIKKFSSVAISKKFGVPLSGGRDSRHILFACMSCSMKPFAALTMKHQPPKSDEDAEVAKKVCSFLNLNHEIINQPLSFLKSEKHRNTITNFCSLEHSWILPLSNYLLKEGYDAIFDGIGGDVLSASQSLTERRLNLYRKQQFEELADEILGSEGYLPKMLTKSAYKQFNRELAVDILIKELKLYANTPNPVGQFFFFNRTRRNVALSSWRILSKNCYVFAPYLEYDLYKFLSSLPAEYILDRTFHQKTIEKSYPEFSHIPYEKKDAHVKKRNHALNYFHLLEFFIDFLISSRKSMVNPSFLLPRIAKGFLSPDYYNKSKAMYKVPVYLSQLSGIVKSCTPTLLSHKNNVRESNTQ